MSKRILPLLCVVLAGCSSVSVQEDTEIAGLAPSARPGVLWVRPFAVPKGVEFDAAAKSEADDPRTRVGRLIAEGILSRADKWVAPGKLVEGGKAAPAGGLLVEGKILRVRQGSRALRLGIGFGAGRSLLETSVKVFNLERSATEPWLVFETSGGSNAEPGLAGMLVPSPVSIPIVVTIVGGTAAAGAITGKGVTEDALRTGRTIAASIHAHLAAHGLMKKSATVKRRGKVPTPAGELALPGLE